MLHKHPARVQAFELNFGRAHVFYPEATPERCTAALLLDIDPIAIVRNRSLPPGSDFALRQYVNDRPYVASSFLSVAIAEVYGSALNGRSKDRPGLVDRPLPLQASLPTVPSRGGASLLRRLFEPLGYAVEIGNLPLDASFPEWEESPYFSVRLQAQLPLQALLSHLYVLLPVLDDEKHYWVGQDEIEKLLQRGEGWLPAHPERELIVKRYLRHRRQLAQTALQRLQEEDQADVDPSQEEDGEGIKGPIEAAVETTLGLHQQRHQAVLAILQESEARRVLDLGCGEGQFLEKLVGDRRFVEIVGVDVSARSLERAALRLKLDERADNDRQRLRLLQSSLMYKDRRLQGYDAAVLNEVIEHIEPSRLGTVERTLFREARPLLVIITTPNREYNRLWPSLPAGQFRHRDHRFEWIREEFRGWVERVARETGYRAEIAPVGPQDPQAGPPTQMGIFRR